jgi:hypothetical protein
MKQAVRRFGGGAGHICGVQKKKKVGAVPLQFPS